MPVIQKRKNGMEIWIPKINEIWQYPVITEKQALTSILKISNNLKNYVYVAIPWATLIDKKNINSVINNDFITSFNKQRSKIKCYITVCQHINFRKIIPILEKLGIQYCFTPHKKIGQGHISNVTIEAFPLYAVNVEDPTRNKIILNNNLNRKYLYSFVGGYNRLYLSKIRLNIFNMNHNENAFIKNTDTWHFNKIVYNQQVRGNDLTKKDINKMMSNNETYNTILLESRYSLCPSGTGPNSIRFWESLAVGSIPVLLADTLQLPYLGKSCPIEWKDAIIVIKESSFKIIPQILANISIEAEEKMRMNCKLLYNYVSKINFAKCLIETLKVKKFIKPKAIKQVNKKIILISKPNIMKIKQIPMIKSKQIFIKPKQILIKSKQTLIKPKKTLIKPKKTLIKPKKKIIKYNKSKQKPKQLVTNNKNLSKLYLYG